MWRVICCLMRMIDCPIWHFLKCQLKVQATPHKHNDGHSPTPCVRLVDHCENGIVRVSLLSALTLMEQRQCQASDRCREPAPRQKGAARALGEAYAHGVSPAKFADEEFPVTIAQPQGPERAGDVHHQPFDVLLERVEDEVDHCGQDDTLSPPK